MPNEITITHERYIELLIAERDAKLLKQFIKNACDKWTGISREELTAICDFYFREEN